MTTNAFHIEGNLISADLLPDIVAGEVKGQQAQDFGLKANDKLEDEIAFIWSEAKSRWAIFQGRLARSPEGETGTSLTREQWVVPLLELLGYQPSYQAKAELIDNQTFAISHRAGQLESLRSEGEGLGEGQGETPPVHIIGCRLSLDKRPPSGTPRLSAHGLVQEYLNRTEHLWGITTNGYQWRLLRDCSLMTRLSYVEFDLGQIFENENFAEFRLFFRLFHRSRLPEGMEDSDKCLLEHYHQESLSQGGRVRDKLRDGVEAALKILGNGFLRHPRSGGLREHFAAGTLTDSQYYRQLLMLIYRCLFLMVAESRNLLLAAEDREKAAIYQQYYSFSRLRDFSDRLTYRPEGFQDLWQGLKVTFGLFEEGEKGNLLGLSPLNGDLFGAETLAVLNDSGLDNHYLLSAVRGLSLYENQGQLRRVNYEALDVEELGSVYESLLDFTPQVTVKDGIYCFDLVTGSDRKTTGSYYTPSELVAQLIKSALEPVIEERLKGAGDGGQTTQEQALLSLKVCDPACGSGHFLLAAARRIGKELARVRTGEIQPPPEPLRQAIRDVIQHCIYGVDINPLAVDLCKVALWIEGFCRGMSLNFLDHRIKCGNSLVGVMDLEVLREGIPDEAFKPVTGDDKTLGTQFKKRNKKEREQSGQLSLFDIDFAVRQGSYAAAALAVDEIEELTPEGYKRKQERYQHLRANAQWWQDFSACNLWTAAFFMPLTEQNLRLIPTTEALKRLLREAGQREQREVQQGSLFAGGETSKSTPFGVVQIVEAANELAANHRFFHWPLEFPEVFERSGFDCVLGNPPWERIKLQEKEFFGSRDPDIATAQNKAEREKLIKTLPDRKPELAKAFEAAKHEAEAQSKFIRQSGRFPLTAVGDINTYAIFSELVREVINDHGRTGIIVPVGIATDNTTKNFFGDLIKTKTLASLTGYENEAFIFSDVHNAFKFCNLSMVGKSVKFGDTDFIFFCRYFKDVDNKKRHFSLSSQDIALINPNTFTCPIFRTNPDAEITKKIYRKVPVLENDATGVNPWGISFMRMFDMANDSGLFENEPGENLLPLYEAKMFHQFDHRFSTYENATQADMNAGRLPQTTPEMKQDFNFAVTPRYWVNYKDLYARLSSRWDKSYLLAWRDIASANNERTVISSLLPKSACSDTVLLMFPNIKKITLLGLLYVNLNTIIFDFVARQKVGGNHLKYFTMRQLPVIPPEAYSPQDIEYISKRVLELTYTAWDMKPFAEDMGYHGDPFVWDENRRAILRAELDAKYAKLYGLTRDELRYILDPADVYGPDFPSETFRVLKNNEIKKYGEYRTQRLVLAAWDMMGY
ncbi:Eco57I restriction-modification methylase domain-containing protein [Synechocystis salina]|uniref:site-specific DNA-methyltransferase (adenine-specific) n=1 Tax=Synechocystis salina LEGE 00031 TaxID=1828736 RepID=A0ABR9VT16_9SYNC|nr:N-6 DNA methylase [Synechocystis salina]MBE9242248.1 N-6 DNA methylase [Synechocystis salina LEGE 00041]MBE9254484.1 N-6 DNA methylase [Synechocystis salina LEGE 00031]